jgi:hypothetical protein
VLAVTTPAFENFGVLQNDFNVRAGHLFDAQQMFHALKGRMGFNLFCSHLSPPV